MLPGVVKYHLNSCLCNATNNFKSLTVACLCQKKASPMQHQKKNLSLDWHEKANCARTSCPKLKWIFLSRCVYLNGPIVDHFMKWSRWAVWHREQAFVQKKTPIFPRQTIFQYLKCRFFGFFFHEKYWIMTSEHFHRKTFVKKPFQNSSIKILFKINASIMCKAWALTALTLLVYAAA